MDIRNTELLTQEQQRSARAWEALFNTPAWEWYVRDAVQMREQLEHYITYSARTEGDMREARGRITVLDQIINLASSTEAEFNNLADEAALIRDELTDSQGANA